MVRKVVPTAVVSIVADRVESWTEKWKATSLGISSGSMMILH